MKEPTGPAWAEPGLTRSHGDLWWGPGHGAHGEEAAVRSLSHCLGPAPLSWPCPRTARKGHLLEKRGCPACLPCLKPPAPTVLSKSACQGRAQMLWAASSQNRAQGQPLLQTCSSSKATWPSTTQRGLYLPGLGSIRPVGRGQRAEEEQTQSCQLNSTLGLCLAEGPRNPAGGLCAKCLSLSSYTQACRREGRRSGRGM